ncbi:hypothetical protein fugu_000044 [Takifugu bimaculatus]|uniref:Nuclear pore glycoprotein p62 n=1 Tax=Takifugu bimaculatus TaxID=433685 RepID=A0A4Z2CFT9_9TELE|nr:hypothetical protein fugu_000044 [Takifugu bimaculatus]
MSGGFTFGQGLHWLLFWNSEDNSHSHRFDLWDDKFHTRRSRRGLFLRHWDSGCPKLLRFWDPSEEHSIRRRVLFWDPCRHFFRFGHCSSGHTIRTDLWFTCNSSWGNWVCPGCSSSCFHPDGHNFRFFALHYTRRYCYGCRYDDSKYRLSFGRSANFSAGHATATAASATTTAAATTVPSTGFTLGLKPAPSTSATATAIASSLTATAAPPVMTYAQLEALINKWSLELEDQERHFLQQATQVNAWDRMLVENGEKITSLHKEMEKVKLDQRRLNQELDFILSQQKELEDLLCPLEESVKEQSGTIYMQNADEERERTYKLAENVDAQLKRMSQDLKEIIEHLNTSSGPADSSDPLQQICKILNTHMDSLQWIDQNSVLLQRRVEEVSKLCDNQRKEQEKTFRLTFD